jgi:putative DNA primase/helicase
VTAAKRAASAGWAAGDAASPLRAVDGDAPAPAQAPKLSEIDLADLWVSRAGADWRHVAEWSAWVQWQEDGWHIDDTGAVRASAVDLLRESEAWEEARGLTAAQRRKLCSAATVAAMLSLASAHRAVAVTSSRWDKGTMLLGVPGGVVDLRTGKMRAASRRDYITKRCAVAPKPGAPRLWLAHLERVLRGDVESIAFLRRYLGYMLTGEIGEHALVFFYGTGRNGKGTIVETVIRLLGDYGYAAPVNLLMESRNERHPTELASLRGRRGVSCSEPPQGSKWDDGRVRSLTGGDTITARMMGQDFTSFTPTHKLILMGNHKPTLRSVDEAIKARFNILDFSVTIPVEERDPNFMDRLREEWPQILQWMIDGCLHWQEDGLGRPASMVEATEEYLQDEDTFGQFLGECCDRGPALFDTVPTMFRAYSAWCEKQGEKPLSRKAFKSALRESPGVERKRAAGDAVSGLALKSGYRPEPISRPSWQED